MLISMRAAEQWAQIERSLDPEWTEARLAFLPETSLADAAAVLAPLQPGRAGDELRLHVRRSGADVERARNIFRQLDRRRIWGTLRLLAAAASEPAAAPEEAPSPGRRTLAEAWDGLVAALPPDWSDLLCELELDSSDHLARAALLGAPLNPARNPDAIALRFRAGKQGYGVSPQMARRCLERMDAEDITGRLTVVYEVSDAENVATQGPVWRAGGRSV